jgi:hypothetical protein
VEEEAELDVLLRLSDLFAQHGGEQHKVVVMDPDQIIVLDIFGNCPRKQAIGLVVCIPSGFIEGDFARVVVEERPEDRVCVHSSILPS